MALDRIIRWKKRPDDIQPGQSRFALFVCDYFGEQIACSWQTDRWFITLPGKPTWPFASLGINGPPLQSERWIEVWIGKDSVDVMTRMQDHFTNSVAEGLAAAIAQFWGGERE